MLPVTLIEKKATVIAVAGCIMAVCCPGVKYSFQLEGAKIE